jgi:hypothetical protein
LIEKQKPDGNKCRPAPGFRPVQTRNEVKTVLSLWQAAGFMRFVEKIYDSA